MRNCSNRVLAVAWILSKNNNEIALYLINFLKIPMGQTCTSMTDFITNLISRNSDQIYNLNMLVTSIIYYNLLQYDSIIFIN